MAAVSDLYQRYLRVNNRQVIWKECLFDEVAVMEPDRMDQVLLDNLARARHEMDVQSVLIKEIIAHTDEAIQRVARVLAKRAEQKKAAAAEK